MGGEIGHLEMKLSQMIEHFHDPTTTVGGLAITGYLYRLARRRGIPPIDAEDIPQDLLMTFMKRLHDGKDSDIPQVGTFLSRSLDNKIIDHKRATLGRDGRKARPTHEISEAIFLSDTSLGPVQTAIMHEYGERINAAMHNLRTNHINLSDLAFERVFRGVS
ncbi:MAG: sigma factor, partial [Candidatus Woesearchaeota archaeon]|nr:sigma factor [Candidatus Woesearchaeota archaeon]